MAGHARYTALLDACVLYPLAVTDALMSLATTGLYAAKWTRRIETEWIESLERHRPDLPDEKDRHVLAAALAGHADCIITANLTDFPASVTDPLGIEVTHPDQFIVAQWDLDQLVTVAAFKRMRSRWKKPQATAGDFAAAIERGGLPATAQRLREAAELI
jgi:hypothetical protein